MTSCALRCGLFLCLFTTWLRAETYFIDYAGGSDSHSGTSAEAAWKHCPGDPEAGGKSQGAGFQPGDKVIFKGGVAYRGEVRIDAQGAEGNPVIVDGNTEGHFGSGRAIIEGGEAVEGWKKCESAEEAMGNPQWKELWFTDQLPERMEPYAANLCQGDVMYHLAVYPCSDALSVWNDVETAFHPSVPPVTSNPEEHSLSDPYFKQKSAEAWNGAYIGIRAGRNFFYMSPVTRFDPASRQVYFKGLEVSYPADISQQRFVMLNALEILTRPGQYVVVPNSQGTGNRMYCWPVAGKNFPEGATISKRPVGINIEQGRHLVIRGFIIQHQAEEARGRGGIGIASYNGKIEDLMIEDNWLRQQKAAQGARSPAVGLRDGKQIVIRKNHLTDILGIGMLISKCEDVLFEENVLDSVLDTTVDFYTCKNVRCLRNRITGRSGLHANGLTFYLGNENVLVEGNLCTHENPLTMQDINGIRVVNNLFDGIGRGNGISIWADKAGKSATNVLIEHNTIVNSNRDLGYCAGLYTANKDGSNWIIRNNILDGAGGNICDKNDQMTHNLFLRAIPKLKGKEMGNNPILELDAAGVFVEPQKGDYRLKEGSPAIGTGIPGDVKTDAHGDPRNETKPDLGAYNFNKG